MEKNRKKSIFKLEIFVVVSIMLLVSSTPIIGANNEISTVKNEQIINVNQIEENAVDISYSMNGFTTESISENGETFQKLIADGRGYTSAYGKPELPIYSYYIAVPQGAEIDLEYQVSDVDFYYNYNIYPSQPPKPETDGYIDPPFAKDEAFYVKNEFYPYSVVEVSPIKIIRGCRIAMITVFPFAYNPVNNILKVYNNVDISINFIGGTGEFIPEKYCSVYFQPIFDSFLINSNSIERAELNNQVGTQSKDSDRADLLIIVYDDFYEEIQPLAQWRHASGIETKVVKLSEIGSTSADIKNYMINAYFNWELPPSFLLIVGDADHVPVNYQETHPYHYTYTGTDHWYVAIDGTDYFPDLHTGRISVEDETELTNVVDKILDYSKTPYMSEDWFSNVLLAAKEEYGRFFVYTSERIYNFLNPLGYNCNRQYQGTSPPGSTQGVIDAIDNGVIIANHRDHGASQNDGYAYTGWSAPQFDTTHIANDIDNGEKYPVMYSLNCDSGWFDGETDTNAGNYESIGEIGIRVANRGFIAVVASTRVSYSGYNDELCCGFYDAIWEDFDPDYPDGGTNPYTTEVYRIGQVLNYGKFWMYDKYVEPGGCSPYPWTPSDVVSRTTFEMFHVHGDPTTDIWTAFPENMDVTYDIFSSSVEVTVTSGGSPVEGALVCISQPTGIYSNGFTDANGEIILDTTGASEEDVTLVATAHNYLCYETTMFLNRAPEQPAEPDGPTEVEVGETYSYTTTTTDYEGEQVFYMWDWGDGNFSDWLGPFDSGETASADYAWANRGPLLIKVKAKDINGGESDWSDPLTVVVANEEPNKPFITGKRIGSSGQTYEFTIQAKDPDQDNVWYYLNWGDGDSTPWEGPYNSNEVCILTHTWEGADIYTVRGKAKDIFDFESEYATFKVVISFNQQSQQMQILIQNLISRLGNTV